MISFNVIQPYRKLVQTDFLLIITLFAA